MQKIHLDTDIGGDIDDLCALAMLLKWKDVEINGITTSAEDRGRRAGYVKYVLKLAKRTEMPVKAGADVNELYRYKTLGYPPEEKNWPEKIYPSPNSVDEALELLKNSVEAGTKIVAIGPYTNLYLLDKKYPGSLKTADLYLMGGYVYPIRKGFPQFDNKSDWNIQVDITSAKYVLKNSKPTLIPLTITAETALKRAYLPKLQESGPVGQLIVKQAELHEKLYNNEKKYGFINFQHDPLAVAIALGWKEEVVFQKVPLHFEEKEGWLYERVDHLGLPTTIVTQINGEKFNQFWLDIISN